MSTPAVHKLRVRVGNAEFTAVGSEDSVAGQYQLFLEAFAAAQVGASCRDSGESESEPDSETEFNHEMFERTFRDDGECVSLRVLPDAANQLERDRDALVLLLYGCQELKGCTEVSSVDLMASARQSGIQRNRLDRTIPGELVRRGGHRKGTRYSLNNRGIARAQDLLEQLFE